MPFLGQGTHTAFVNQGGDQRNFTRQGSVQALDKARFRRGNASKSKGFFVAGREKLGSGRADSASASKKACPFGTRKRGGARRISVLATVLRSSSVAGGRLRPAAHLRTSTRAGRRGAIRGFARKPLK